MTALQMTLLPAPAPSRRNRKRATPALVAQALAHSARLQARGCTMRRIEEHANAVGVHRDIRRGVEVTEARCLRILAIDFWDVIDFDRAVLPSGPLLDRIDRVRHANDELDGATHILAARLGATRGTLASTISRARQRGWVTVSLADDLAVAAHSTLEELYGPDWDETLQPMPDRRTVAA